MKNIYITNCNSWSTSKLVIAAFRIYALLLIGLLCIISACSTDQKNKQESTTTDESEKVVLITLDGLRWQEVFTGSDSVMVHSEYTKKKDYIIETFGGKTAQERRHKLMPFFWSTLKNEGVIYGNRAFENKMNLTNNMWFSYPGYSEILTGIADDKRVFTNDKNNNPNQTILELLNNTEEFKGKVGAFGSWDLFPFIINEDRSGLYVNGGYRKAIGENLTDKEKYLNTLQDQAIQPWLSVRQDVFTHNYALEYIKKEHPKFVFVGYGETDNFAHDANYMHYLMATKNTDTLIKELWEYCQSDPYYKDKTTFIITTDHGRGKPVGQWREHGNNSLFPGKYLYDYVAGSDQVWIAAIGSQIKQIGESKEKIQLYTNQIVPTIVKLLDANIDTKDMGKPINQFIK